MMYKAWYCLGVVPYWFSRSSVKFQGHMAEKIVDFDPDWAGSGLYLQFEFTDGHGMMHKDWSSIEEVPYYFSRFSIKFQGHKGQIFLILSGIERFRTVNPVEFTNGFEIIYKAWSSIKEVPYCLSKSSIKFQGRTGQKIANFDPNWAFRDCNCSLNSPMGLKWCTRLGVVQKRCPIVFGSHPSNLKVTWTEKSMIFRGVAW